jgi:hypothetical protein
MDGGNGSEKFYQDNLKKPYVGKEQRADSDRPKLTPEGQAIVNALRSTISCKNSCILSQEVQEVIPVAVSSIKEIGKDGTLADGVNKSRDICKDADGFIKTHRKNMDRMKNVAIAVLTSSALYFIGDAIITKIRGG